MQYFLRLTAKINSQVPQTNLNLRLLKKCPRKKFHRLQLVGIIHWYLLKVATSMPADMVPMVNWALETKNLRLSSHWSLKCKISPSPASLQEAAILGWCSTTWTQPEKFHLQLWNTRSLLWAISKKPPRVRLAPLIITSMSGQALQILIFQLIQDQLSQRNLLKCHLSKTKLTTLNKPNNYQKIWITITRQTTNSFSVFLKFNNSS